MSDCARARDTGPTFVESKAPGAATLVVRQSLSQFIDTEEIEEDTPLMDAGINSNSAVALRSDLAGKLQLPRLSRTLLFDYPSIASISDHIKTYSGEYSIPCTCSSQSARAPAVSGKSAFQRSSPRCQQMNDCARARDTGPTFVESKEPDVARLVVRQSLSQFIGAEEIEEDTPLTDMSINFNLVVILRNDVAGKLQLPRLSRTLLFDYPSIASISDHIKTYSGEYSIPCTCSSQSARAPAAIGESPSYVSGRDCPWTSIGST
jgi:hypothetical protein